MRTYQIDPRPADLGGGWSLKLYEDDEEMGGGVFPIENGDPHQGMGWWNRLPEKERSLWLAAAESAVPADAWTAYLLGEAYQDALDEGTSWVGSDPEADYLMP